MNKELLELSIKILIGCLLAFIAKKRGRSPMIWFFIGLLFGLLGAIVIYILPKVQTESIQQEEPPQQVTIVPEFSEKEAGHRWFYLNNEHKTRGPLSFYELQNLWHKGQITEKQYIWREGMTDWAQIATLPHLIAQLQSRIFK